MLKSSLIFQFRGLFLSYLELHAVEEIWILIRIFEVIKKLLVFLFMVWYGILYDRYDIMVMFKKEWLTKTSQEKKTIVQYPLWIWIQESSAEC